LTTLPATATNPATALGRRTHTSRLSSVMLHSRATQNLGNSGISNLEVPYERFNFMFYSKIIFLDLSFWSFW
jgi:hypothetical protein